MRGSVPVDTSVLDWKGIVIHHTVTSPDATVALIDKLHQRRHFGVLYKGRVYHIGYHYIVRYADGRYVVEPGRPLGVPGAHCRGYNKTHIGVALCGDFTKVAPELEQQYVAAAHCLHLIELFGMKGDERVIFHRDAKGAHTECPGLAWSPAEFGGKILGTMVEEVT